MNRGELQQLAELRIRDAEALLSAQQWSGAYYLAGYAVECALKACIAKLTSQYDFPDKNFVNKCYVHDLERLIDLAGLEPHLLKEMRQNGLLESNWRVVKNWNEDYRYKQSSELEARKLFNSIADPKNGLYPWIQNHW